MLWVKIITALLWLLPALAVFSPHQGKCVAYVSHPLRVDRTRSGLISAWPRRQAPLLCASAKSKHDDTTSTAAVTPVKRRSWEESYALLCEFQAINGHCNVPQSEKPLGTWVNTQRIEHSRYLLRHEILHIGNAGDEKRKLPNTSMNAQRKKLLDDIGFVWDAMGHTWNTRYGELCEFRKLNGHCVVPRSNGRLGAWTEKQRIEYKKYCAMQEDTLNKDDQLKTILTEDRVRKMDDIGFVWDVREKQFEQKLGQLRIFKQMNGHIDPRMMDGGLALWVRRREHQYKKYSDAADARFDEDSLSGILPEDRRIALEELGFCRDMSDEPRARSMMNPRATWEERYEELQEYKVEHGHCVVPKKYGPLGSWVRAQRHLMKEDDMVGSPFESGGPLCPERVDRLNRLGFVWDVHQWQWNQTYHELLQYKEQHNDTNVPMSYGNLGLWVFNQRAHYKSFRKNKTSGMTETRVAMLKEIGFEFDLGQKIRSAADQRWQMRLNELKEYKDTWGTLSVKQMHNPALYNWCQNQKSSRKNSNLKKPREEALKSIGFI